MNSPRVTLAQVAAHLGTTKMTVHRALNGSRGVSEHLRAKIRAAANELGYVPDPTLSAAMARMRTKHTDLETIAWLSTYPEPQGWKKNFMISETYRGAMAKAERMGYRIEEFCVNQPGMTSRWMGNILYNRSIRGIIVAPLLHRGSIENFPWQHFAAVSCGHSLLHPHLNRVVTDQFQVVLLAMQSLAARGYQRIGLFASKSDNSRVNSLWLGANLAWQDDLPLLSRVPPLITDDWNPERFLQWYREHKPDAVLSYPEVHDWMTGAGIRVPEDCGFALLNFDPKRTLAGVDHLFDQIGATSVSLLGGGLSANQYGVPEIRQTISTECVWRDGTSIRTPPQPAKLRRRKKAEV